MSSYIANAIECTALRISCDVNYGLQVMMMALHMIIDYNRCTTLVQDSPSGKAL